MYIIAGSTGTLGSAIADDLSKSNEIFLIGRDEDKLKEQSSKYNCKFEVIDLSNTPEPRDFTKVIDPDVEIKGLVNCIGSILIKPLHGTSLEEFNDIISTNLFSSYFLLASFARRMKEGSAIFFSSVAGTKGLSNHEAISAAKAGIEGFARSAAATYAKDNLRVNVIAPSIMDSNMSQKILSSDAAIELSKNMHPISKIGDADDILPVIKWLLSPDARWVTGQTIHVDGGLSTVKPR
jgi:NAD(P)-dependent dehydrogenase (short-subunit alcohol dehydrogenase family)